MYGLEWKGEIKETETRVKPGETTIDRNLHSVPQRLPKLVYTKLVCDEKLMSSSSNPNLASYYRKQKQW